MPSPWLADSAPPHPLLSGCLVLDVAGAAMGVTGAAVGAVGGAVDLVTTDEEEQQRQENETAQEGERGTDAASNRR